MSNTILNLTGPEFAGLWSDRARVADVRLPEGGGRPATRVRCQGMGMALTPATGFRGTAVPAYAHITDVRTVFPGLPAWSPPRTS